MIIDKEKLYLIIAVAAMTLLIFIFWIGFVQNNFQKIDAGEKVGDSGVKREIEDFFNGAKEIIKKSKQSFLDKYEKSTAEKSGI